MPASTDRPNHLVPSLEPKRGSAGTGPLWRDGFQALGPDRPRLLLTGLLATFSGLLEAVLLYLIAKLALVITSDPRTVVVGGIGPVPEREATTGGIVAVAAVILVVLILLSVPLMRSIASLSTRSLVRTRSRLISAYLGSSWAFRSSEREGHFAQLVGEYCQRIEQLVMYLGIVMVATCQIVMLMAAALVASAPAALAAIVGLGVLGVVIRPLSKSVHSGSIKNAAENRNVVNDAQQVTRLGAEITSFHVGPAVVRTLEVRIRDAARQLRRMRFVSRLVPVLYQYCALGIVLGIIGLLVLIDAGDLSGVAPVILLLLRALTYLRQLLTATQAGAELAPYFEVVEEAVQILDASRPSPGSRDIADFTRVAFEDVSFEYEAGRPVLTAVEFTIDQHEVIGLIGASGGGKTTMTQLLLRLREPTSGRISVDGVDLREITAEAWSRLTAYVPQDNKLILGSVADNICFYRDGFTREQVEEAARRARLHDEILTWPDGYDTLIGPGARSLSGGQCQRLGIARALVGRPRLLILDEPTSALDHRTEELVRETLADVGTDSTVVLVAHRPATIEVCTRVLLVEGHTVTAADALAGELPARPAG